MLDVVMISAASPFMPFDGQRLAVLSDVRACLRVGLSLGVLAFTYEREPVSGVEPLCAFEAIPARRGDFATRLVRGFVSGFPPSAERLYSQYAFARIRSRLQAWRPSTVILNDVSVAGYIPLIREMVPRAKIIVRSHNVMYDVRKAQLEKTNLWLRPLVSLDTDRYIEMERTSIVDADDYWAISQRDAFRFQQLYKRSAKVLSVSVDSTGYLPGGTAAVSDSNFVHVGSIDYRRRADFLNFLKVQWPRILTASPESKLIFAGKVRGKCVNATNVQYLGFIKDDRDAYRAGRFALNFQTTTGGIKIKTLTALAARRVLLTGPAGVEGFGLEQGRHYLDLGLLGDDRSAKQLFRDFDQCRSIADSGHEYVLSHHSIRAMANQLSSNLN